MTPWLEGAQKLLSELQRNDTLRERTDDLFPCRTEDAEKLGALSHSPSGAPFINLTSNDTLGLLHDPGIHEILETWGKGIPYGSGGSRLLGGGNPFAQGAERALSDFLNLPSSLMFSTGYLANLAIGQTLRKMNAHIFSDEKNHASTVDSLRGYPHKTIYRHLDLSDLEEKLSRSRDSIKVILTESLFSMDGDQPAFRDLGYLARKYQATVLLDEAHSFFIYHDGRGFYHELGLETEEFAVIVTGGKAMALQGAWIAGPNVWIEAIVNFGRSFIYSTAPSPHIAHLSAQMLKNSYLFTPQRQALQGVLSAFSQKNHLLLVPMGSSRAALKGAQYLQTQGILTKAIRPPTVPEGEQKLRLSLHAGLSLQEIQRIKDGLRHL